MRSKDKVLMDNIVKYVDLEFSKCGRVPTQQEIASKFGVTKQCISKYIKEMIELGMLKINNGSRGIITNTMLKTQNEISSLPLVGTISCGTPLLAEENIETYLPIPKVLLGNGEFFILRAKGNSMINAGICEGDYVIVKKQDSAEEGQIVVALLEDEATLKRFYRDNRAKKIRLHPENSEMQDMYFDNVIIQGIAVKVIKDII